MLLYVERQIQLYETRLLKKISTVKAIAEKLLLNDTDTIMAINDERIDRLQKIWTQMYKSFQISPKLMQLLDDHEVADEVVIIESETAYTRFYGGEGAWKLDDNYFTDCILGNLRTRTGNRGERNIVSQLWDIDYMKTELKKVYDLLETLEREEFTYPAITINGVTPKHG